MLELYGMSSPNVHKVSILLEELGLAPLPKGEAWANDGRTVLHVAVDGPEKAIAVMNELGIDISHHRSKNVREFEGQPSDHVLTVW